MGSCEFVVVYIRTLTPSAIVIMNKILAVLVLTAMVATMANAGVLDCLTCGKDIEQDIKDCANQATEKERVTCALDCMKTTTDCMDCICSILATVFKLDSSICDRKSVANLVPNHRI